MMKMQTRNGRDVELTYDPESCYVQVALEHPEYGRLVGSGRWTDEQGGGILYRATVAGRYQPVLAQVSRADYESILPPPRPEVIVGQAAADLRAVRDARNEEDRLRRRVARSEDGLSDGHYFGAQERARTLSAEWHAKYPRESAYLCAESWSAAANVAKAEAGKRAAKRIEDGEPYEQALRDMEAEWAAYTAEHAWD